MWRDAPLSTKNVILSVFADEFQCEESPSASVAAAHNAT
jgi:hypothetical protein